MCVSLYVCASLFVCACVLQLNLKPRPDHTLPTPINYTSTAWLYKETEGAMALGSRFLSYQNTPLSLITREVQVE